MRKKELKWKKGRDEKRFSTETYESARHLEDVKRGNETEGEEDVTSSQAAAESLDELAFGEETETGPMEAEEMEAWQRDSDDGYSEEFGEDADWEASPREYNLQAAQSRRKRRRKIKKRRTLLLLIFAVALAVTGIIAAEAYLSTNVYQDDDEFRAYAAKKFYDNDMFKVNGTTQKVYEYGTPISYAADYDIIDNETIENFRQSKMQQLKDEYIAAKTAEEKTRAEENKDNKRYKAPAEALIVNSAAYYSENGAVSIAIGCSANQEQDKDMVTVSSSVNTYLLSQKTGNAILPEQVFMPEYRDRCSEYFTEYFASNYDESELSENWKDYVSNAYTNFNKFILEDRTATFFFDEGTVADKSKGVIAVKMTRSELGEDLIREAVIERYVDPNKPMVALTYDDGPGGESETKILDCLEKNNAVATFFYMGKMVSKNPEKIKRAQNMGCELGNHTWSHPLLTKHTSEEVKEEISKTNEAIKSACGSYPTLFRPSYGDTNDSVNALSGLPVIMWSIDTLDWKTRDAGKTFECVTKAAEKSQLDGKIILMHSIHEPTAEATERIVPWLIENGYQTVTVSELIKYKKGEQLVNGKVYR